MRIEPQLCHYCDAPATTSDHIVPRALGGADAQYNRVPSCLPCNQAKADRMPTCQCFKCRAAVNMPRRPGKKAKRKPRRRLPDHVKLNRIGELTESELNWIGEHTGSDQLRTLSAFVKWPSGPGEAS